MAKELFLSYGREPEVISFVTQLKHDLQRNGFSVWLDTEDIPAGSDWHAAIGTGLDQCKALIAVISNKYITSRYCMSELYTANGDQKLIFPVIVENVEFSATERARGVKYVVSGINWTMCRQGYDDYNASLDKLMSGMREQGLGSPVDGTDSGVGDLPERMAQLQVSPSAPPLPLPPANPGYSAPYPLPPSPANPAYQQTTPPGPYTTPPHPSHYPYPYPYPGFSPSPHGQQPYPEGYYTSPPGGYVPPAPVQYPNPAPGQPYYPPPTTTGYPAYPTQPEGASHDPPPPYRQLFAGSEEVDTTQAASLPDLNFRVGLKLEAVDRRFPYFVCVATVMDRKDNNVMVHFDGWGPEYNYWCSRDSVELHPPGWCDKHKWTLQEPLNQEWPGWAAYLSKTQADGAEEELFTANQLAGPESLLFSPGMRVEAKDRMNPSMICAATIKEVDGGRVLIHFDGWGDQYDYWCEAESTDIHPPMWCGKNGRQVHPPNGYKGQFKWSQYLANEKINPAPAHIFTEEQISVDGQRKTPKASNVSLDGFKVGMKLEAKDRLSPTMICVATIKDIKDGQLLIQFDGWSSKFDYWCKPTSDDIHPRGWCEANGRDVNPPKDYIHTFDWNTYLTNQSAIAAPEDLFTKKQREVSMPQASPVPRFKAGMKLEAKDRKYPTLVCVATITEVKNDQLLIHFDGWNNDYDYWCESTSTDIHPVGWCEAQGHALQKPKGHNPNSHFSWSSYLTSTSSTAAPSHLFPQSQHPGSTGCACPFKAGMKLEAKDRKNPSLVCVATIAEVKDNRLLIHFDGWSNAYDYWCEPTSTDIHPVGWCEAKPYELQRPNGHSGSFNWSSYLASTSSIAAPSQLFTESQKPSSILRFKAGMKLEAKDRKNPSLVCVATITEVKNNQLLIHFDGWTSKYDYWCEATTPDIHPIGWCRAQGWQLQAPKGHSGSFTWNDYLTSTSSVAAPKELFTESQKPTKYRPKFKYGMKLEAKDRKHPTFVCVATIAEVKDNRLLIHFDGWSNAYDYWCEPTSTDIHPIGWCEAHHHPLQKPHGYDQTFSWDTYLEESWYTSGAVPAPKTAFNPEQCA